MALHAISLLHDLTAAYTGRYILRRGIYWTVHHPPWHILGHTLFIAAYIHWTYTLHRGFHWTYTLHRGIHWTYTLHRGFHWLYTLHRGIHWTYTVHRGIRGIIGI